MKVVNYTEFKTSGSVLTRQRLGFLTIFFCVSNHYCKFYIVYDISLQEYITSRMYKHSHSPISMSKLALLLFKNSLLHVNINILYRNTLSCFYIRVYLRNNEKTFILFFKLQIHSTKASFFISCSVPVFWDALFHWTAVTQNGRTTF
jgi:hypothetical protein